LRGDYFSGVPKLRELDMTLYSGKSFPTSVLSLSLLEELHADWSSTSSSTLDFSQMVSLRTLSLTGMGLTNIVLPSNVQKLFLAFNRLRVSLGSLLASLTQLALLDYEGSLADDSALTEPLNSDSLECLLLGPGTDGKQRSWGGQGGGSLPKLKVADLRGVSLRTVLPADIKAPSLRLVCAHEADMAECTKKFPSAKCATGTQCKSAYPCSPPRFPIFVGFPQSLRDTILSTAGVDLPCSACDSKCYNRSVLGNESYPLFTAPLSNPPTPSPSAAPGSGGSSAGTECESQTATQAIAGLCLPSIGTNQLMKPTGTSEQAATDSNLALVSQYASILGELCAKSLKQLLCSVPFPRCVNGQISRVCGTLCKEANTNCASIAALLPDSVKKYMKCDDATVYGTTGCFTVQPVGH